MPNRRVKRRKLSPSEKFHQFLQLPLDDLMVPGISKYMDLQDIFNFRCCSRYCKELAESALAAHTSVGLIRCNDMGFSVITQYCRRLREVKLGFMDKLTDEMLIPLFSNNPLLEYVNLSFCGPLTPKALYPLVNCKNLTKLHLVGPLCDDAFLEMLNEHEVHLEHVDLMFAMGYSEQVACDFFRKQPRLKYIALPNLDSWFQETLEAIAECCQDLRQLNMREYNKDDHEEALLKNFLRASPKLEKICIQRNQVRRLSKSLRKFLEEVNVSVESTIA